VSRPLPQGEAGVAGSSRRNLGWCDPSSLIGIAEGLPAVGVFLAASFLSPIGFS